MKNKLIHLKSRILKHKYLSNILLTETRDELLKTVTITDVSVTKDLGIAIVYFTSIN